MEMGVPLQDVSCGGDRDDKAGAQVASGPTADELDGRFCARPSEHGEEIMRPLPRAVYQTSSNPAIRQPS